MDDFELLKKKIHADRGFNCESYKNTSLSRRISIRMKATKTSGYKEYAEYLSKNPKEYDNLIDVLTVNFTEFFRDAEMYDFLGKAVIPEIKERKKREGRRILRIWSAGCSSGQEPYSLAILISEQLGQELKDFMVTLRATDIDDQCLAEAKRGEYEPEALKNMAPALVEKYFEKKGEVYSVKNKARDLIRFEKHDLISGAGKKYFDIILCRNVFIYFSRDAQKGIFEMFHDALNRDGYLIIGKTETMHEDMYDKFEIVSLSERIFRKIA